MYRDRSWGSIWKEEGLRGNDQRQQLEGHWWVHTYKPVLRHSQQHSKLQLAASYRKVQLLAYMGLAPQVLRRKSLHMGCLWFLASVLQPSPLLSLQPLPAHFCPTPSSLVFFFFFALSRDDFPGWLFLLLIIYIYIRQLRGAQYLILCFFPNSKRLRYVVEK